MANSAIHSYLVDNVHASMKFRESLDVECAKKGLAVLEDLQTRGLITTNYDELIKILEKAQKNIERPIDASMVRVPHPVRVFDYMNLPLVISQITQMYCGHFLGMASNPSFTAEDIEDVITHIHQFGQEAFPDFCQYLTESGSGTMMNQYIPLMQVLRKAPIFELEESACIEIENLDIARGVDSTYLRAPAPMCYFTLGKTNAKLHDGISGWHELEGFYVTETETTTRKLSRETAKRMGLDTSKPMRCMSIIFTGKPFDKVSNDSLCKIDIYLQDGISIDQIMRSTAEWYCGHLENMDHIFDVPEIEGDTSTVQYSVENNISNIGEMNVEHNVGLIKIAIDVLAYLNFAPFRRKQSTERSDAEKIVAAKSPQNRPKAFKKVLGKVDRITITSNISELTGAGGKTGESHTKSKHFRRGHLRNQRYGSGDNIHYKPIYIAPMIIAGGEGDEDITPKPYRVK